MTRLPTIRAAGVALVALSCGLNAALLGQNRPVRTPAGTLVSHLFDSLEIIVNKEAQEGVRTNAWFAYARLHELAGSLDSAQSLLLILSDKTPHLDSLISQGSWRYELPWKYRSRLPSDSAVATREHSTNQMVVTLFPNSAEAWSDLGNSRAKNDDLTGALDAHQRAIELEPNSLARKLYKARTLARYSTYQDARLYYDSLLQLTSMKSEDVYWDLADLERKRGSRNVAAEAYKNAMLNHTAGGNPFFVAIHGDSAAALIAEELGQETLVHAISVASEADPTDDSFHALLGDAYSRAGNHADALLRYRAAAAQTPMMGTYSFKIGSELFYLDRFEEALRAFREAFEGDSTNTPALFNIAAALVNLSRYREAQRAYAEYVIREPQEALGWVRLGWSTSRVGGPDREVEAYFEKAIALNSAVFDSTPEVRELWESVLVKVGEQKPATISLVRQSILGQGRSERSRPTASAPSSSGKPQMPKALTGTGSGFAVGSSGEVITNWHVTNGCAGIRVRSINGAKSTADIIGEDKANDLALLRVKDLVATPLSFRSSSVRPGESLVTLGFPLSGILATQPVNATGTVSALAGVGNDARLMQISAPLQAGNSGGPVLDQAGAIIGIVVSKLDAARVYRATGDVPQNVNFAVKATIAKTFLEANGVTPLISTSRADRSTPDVVQIGRMGTVAIECLK